MKQIVGIADAADILGVERSWLIDAPIPRMDYRKPGGERAVWRWNVAELEAFKASRVVLPGHVSPL